MRHRDLCERNYWIQYQGKLRSIPLTPTLWHFSAFPCGAFVENESPSARIYPLDLPGHLRPQGVVGGCSPSFLIDPSHSVFDAHLMIKQVRLTYAAVPSIRGLAAEKSRSLPRSTSLVALYVTDLPVGRPVYRPPTLRIWVPSLRRCPPPTLQRRTYPRFSKN